MMSPDITKTIRVLLVDDHKSFMDGLAMVIDSQSPAMEIVAKASSPEEALTYARREKPDIILLDMDLGVILSLEILPELLSRSDAKILILTGLADAELHEQAIAAGARGVIMKNEPARVILKAIEKVYQGQVWVDNAILTRVLARMNKQPAGRPARTEQDIMIAELTSREREIISTLVIHEASTNGEIAGHLHISQSTLKNHLTTIYSKLGMKNRIQLLKFALSHNLAEPPRSSE